MMANLKDRGEFCSNGFQPLSGTWNEPYGETNGGASMAVSEQKKQEMVHIVKTCKEHHIKLMMVTSPYYGKFTSSRTLEVTDSICRAYQVPYQSFLNCEAFHDGSLFSTGDHLNGQGANVFTSMVASWIKGHL